MGSIFEGCCGGLSSTEGSPREEFGSGAEGPAFGLRSASVGSADCSACLRLLFSSRNRSISSFSAWVACMSSFMASFLPGQSHNVTPRYRRRWSDVTMVYSAFFGVRLEPLEVGHAVHFKKRRPARSDAVCERSPRGVVPLAAQQHRHRSERPGTAKQHPKRLHQPDTIPP